MSKTTINAECRVPESWLKSLLALSERVQKQIDELPAEAHTVLFKTDISALTGFASSAEMLIKYNIEK